MTHLRYGQPVAYHHTSVYLVANTRKTIVGAPWSIHSAPRESNPGVVWKGRLAACLQGDHVRRARRGVHPWIGAPLYWTDLDPSALCWRCDRRPRCRPRPPTSASNSFLPLPILSPPVLFCAIPTPRPFNTGNPHLPSATQHRPCAFGTASDRLSNAAWCLRVIFE